MNPEIKFTSEKNFAGKRLKMSFADNKTFELWRGFMPRNGEIVNKIGTELYSIEVYSERFFDNFDPHQEFEKWAAVEVSDSDNIPEDLETLNLAAGIYAVFVYKGKSSEAANFYQNIFGNWLPNSEYILDARPHFARMGEKYKNDADDSEEEIFIPIKMK